MSVLSILVSAIAIILFVGIAAYVGKRAYQDGVKEGERYRRIFVTEHNVSYSKELALLTRSLVDASKEVDRMLNDDGCCASKGNYCIGCLEPAKHTD